MNFIILTIMFNISVNLILTVMINYELDDQLLVQWSITSMMINNKFDDQLLV